MTAALRIVVLVVAAFASATAHAAVDRAALERKFQTWLVSDIWPEAETAKVSRATFDRAFDGITLDWKLPDLEPPGEPVKPAAIDWQREFGPPGNYFGQDGLATLARIGRAHLKTWAKTLAAIERRYGVPAEILVAIWGKESGYGAAALPKPAVRTLATQAFIGRRADFYRKELVAALKILESHDIAPDGMHSSIAGALGQPQFMPSLFLHYAQDFDGDGHRDIWESVPDTLASIARFLQGEGWIAGRTWGVEASVPANVACSLEGPEQGKPIEEWAKLGVTRADGKPLPADDTAALSYLLMPAGRFGPAFIVTDNFYVLKRYNNTDLYALYVGHLGDRFARDRAFVGKWGKVGGFTRADVKIMQDALVAEGHDVGKPDGLIGFKTRIAVGLWQAKQGAPATCLPDAAMLKGMR